MSIKRSIEGIKPGQAEDGREEEAECPVARQFGFSGIHGAGPGGRANGAKHSAIMPPGKILEALNKSILDFSRRLVPDLPAAGRRRSTTYIPVGVHPCRRERASCSAIFTLLQNQSLMSQILATHPCVACLRQAGNSDLNQSFLLKRNAGPAARPRPDFWQRAAVYHPGRGIINPAATRAGRRVFR